MGKLSEHTRGERRGDPSRVLVIGDQSLLLDALRIGLESENLEVATVGTNHESWEPVLQAFDPYLVVFEASGQAGEQSLAVISRLKVTERVVLGIARDAVSVAAARMVDAGADCTQGLDDGFESLLASIRRCLSGNVVMPLDQRYVLESLLRQHRKAEASRWLRFRELSPRERDIFASVYEGLSAEQIAEEACVSVSTVRTHVRSILSKLNVHSQLSAVAMARSNGWFAEAS
ncbi:MAG: response regulator transcription factor [Acidimicrobiia bacterium]|nr:response regulator transcription factor [Acidimicrobiia bacterium]